MKKEADRVKRWRERQKAEGKTSFTILLSQDARAILAEEKEKTGDSYAVIVEKALKTMKKKGQRPSAMKHFSKLRGMEGQTNVSTIEHQSPVVTITSNENGGHSRILIDDLASYSSEGSHPEQAWKEQNGIYDLKSNEGLIKRLLHSSAASFGRRKKWFK